MSAQRFTCGKCQLQFQARGSTTAEVLCPVCNTSVWSPTQGQVQPTSARPQVNVAAQSAPGSTAAVQRRLFWILSACLLAYLLVGAGLAGSLFRTSESPTLSPNTTPSTTAALGRSPSEEKRPSVPALFTLAEISNLDDGQLLATNATRSAWEQKLHTLRETGLDIVIIFDSTGSMQREIDQLKSKIETIGKTLFKLIPNTRISLCTYRDHGNSEEYLVKGESLTKDLSKLRAWLEEIRAKDGGDEPEAVEAGLRWAIEENRFDPRATKVLLLFGDAPPHTTGAYESSRRKCLELASKFRKEQKGIVSTVTCQKRKCLPDFVDIAKAGGGEAFLAEDHKKIVEQLVILVFGSEHTEKVREAFQLLER